MTKQLIINNVQGSFLHIPSNQVRRNTIKALWRLGYNTRSCGGWTAISAPGVECPEPGQHILERDFSLIAPVLESMTGAGYWDVYFAVKQATSDHFKCCAGFDSAMKYAVRKGYIASPGWTEHQI